MEQSRQSNRGHESAPEPNAPERQELADKASAPIPAKNLMDPRFYLNKLAENARRMDCGDITELQAQRRQDNWCKLFEKTNGVPLQNASQALRDPIERLADRSLLEQNETELRELETAIAAIPGLPVTQKKKWRRLIQDTLSLQHTAKQSAIALWTYVGRDSESGDIFKMSKIQASFFGVWNDDTHPHSLTMAPPGHSKTTCLRGQIIWEIANRPSLRILILYDTDTKSKKEMAVLKQYLRGGHFRALYPHIGVLGRGEGAEDSVHRFTVRRPNMGSREPTVEGAAITSQINGNGYDHLYVDDPCPTTVARQEGIRKNIIFKWDNEIEQRLRNPQRSRIRMICTPWHEDDLAGHIRMQIAEGSRFGWRVAIDEFRIKDDADGMPIPLWPEMFNSRFYEEQRMRLRPNDYARLYMLVCRAESERIVSRLHYYPSDQDDPVWDELHPEHAEAHRARLDAIRNGEHWLSIDPSATSGRDSTETATSEFVITASGNAYLVDAWFFPGNPVKMQEWIVQRIANGGIHRVLIEAQGGMKGQVVLWCDYIRRRLRELNVKWNGSLIQTRTQKGQTGQNIGKTQRLINSAAYLENGILKVAGRMKIKGAVVMYVCSKNPRMNKLCMQILNYTSGKGNDGVDTVTQFLIYNESRLRREGQDDDKIKDEGWDAFDDSMKVGMAAALKTARNAGPKSDMAQEHQWISQRF